MNASYKKQVLPDPISEGKTYTNYELEKNAQFCCDEFKEFCKKFTAWSYEQGRFAIVDNISYEGQTVRAIDYCPFCGEKITYAQIKS